MSIHITCGTGGGYSERGSTLPVERAALLWSETLSSPGTSANAAPSAVGYSYASAILTVTALDAPAWVAIGASPNPSANVAPHWRRYLLAGQMIQVEAQPGDKVAWAAVS